MSTVQPTTTRRPFQFGLRSALILVTLTCLLFALVAWYQRTVGEKRRCIGSIGAMLGTLPNRRPPEMTPRQWANAAGWTANNLFGNSQLHYIPVDLRALKRFERELKAKLAEKVDFNTILWIWDQFAELTPLSRTYNEKYRQQMIEDSSPEGSKRADYR